MCGRFTLIRLADFTDLFPWILPPDSPPPPRYNIAPTQPIAVVPNLPEPKIDYYYWGLVPSWAKDISIGNRMINARAESLAEKPAFKTAFKRRRCLIPASGFYEWKKEGKARTPMYIHLKSDKPLAFAGLWESWHAPDGSELRSCTIITIPPNLLMASIHDRMPAIISPDHYKAWLSPDEKTPSELEPLLVPFPAEKMIATPVSRLVNSPKNDSPDCIASPADPPDASLFG